MIAIGVIKVKTFAEQMLKYLYMLSKWLFICHISNRINI